MTRNLSGTCILTAGLLLGATAAQAGDEAAQDWRHTLKNMGKVYSNKDGGPVQEVKLFGRVHGQWNYSDGESAGENFDGDGEELRRLRAGVSISFLDGFKALGRMNLEEGGFKDTELGYDGWDELYISYGTNDVMGFDKASVGYGRYKLKFGGEERVSSKKIKTIERSAINNRFGSRRPTGVQFNAEMDGVQYNLGVWSTEPEDETWAGWDEDVAVQAGAIFPAAGGEVTLDFIYADDEDADETVFDYEWAGSVTFNRKFGDVNVLTNATFSEAGAVDPFGIVILPSVFIVDNTLEAAFRYQWASSNASSGVPRSSSSRGLRRVAREEGLQTGSGEEYHAVYAGLNYYVAGDNLKFMTGLEYETIDGDSDRELDGVTFWLATRIYF